ncbi:zinc-binding alcohol dehydrogenase family protein [Flavihumibacter profundi]|uniref:zinc-binding alcohol dehydrogenase family protein n=1 Tax=Flavihumibacter profundi TaxID=2716883 RepID=UPI001CC49472|nr:zinc-binding alcohol dehydrogenase family protein [Flavihumibacter profundi]MBZ5856000.1 zinc-binding alcohol dehydrogenase family protein [Flavihumibacter profundi]
MKALVCTKPGQLDYVEMAEPELQPAHAIIKLQRVCVCGTDLHAFDGTQPYFNYPRILGHELSGELIAFDQAPGFTKGDLVTIIPYFSCGQCLACRTGKPNCCANIKVCGVHVDGGMVEFLQVPSYSLVHSSGLNASELALVEPLAIGAHGIRRAQIQEGEYVLVIGAGPIGLGTMEFARIAGARVIAMDVNEKRLNIAQTKFQIPYSVNALGPNVSEQIRQITHGDMPSVVIDATGNQQAINNGLNYLTHSGRYVLIGLQKGDLIFSHPEFHKRETTLMSSRNATREDFYSVIKAINDGLVNPSDYISMTVGFEQAKSAFSEWATAPDDMIKLAITM